GAHPRSRIHAGLRRRGRRAAPAEPANAHQLERDDFVISLSYSWSMIFVRKPVPTFRDHALIRQGRDRDDLDDEVGMRQRGDPDHLRGWGIVGAAVLWAMLGEELVQHVLTEVGRAHRAAAGKWSFHEKGELDQVVERGAELLQVGFDIGQYGAPLRGRV